MIKKMFIIDSRHITPGAASDFVCQFLGGLNRQKMGRKKRGTLRLTDFDIDYYPSERQVWVCLKFSVSHPHKICFTNRPPIHLDRFCDFKKLLRKLRKAEKWKR